MIHPPSPYGNLFRLEVKAVDVSIFGTMFKRYSMDSLLPFPSIPYLEPQNITHISVIIPEIARCSFYMLPKHLHTVLPAAD